MSNTKTVMGQAANTLTALPNVEDVFSTYLFSANNSTQKITNGIDLDGEGGLVWLKSRTNTYSHGLYDTERGVNLVIYSDLSNAEGTTTNLLNSFNSDGFTLGQNENSNFSSGDSVSWTFRKAPKFFTCLTYTGTGSAQNISHDLGSVPGTIMIKRTSAIEDWLVYHRSTGNEAGTGLNETAATYTGVSAYWNSTTPTDSVFTVGTHDRVNTSGQTYVAYLFAHNDGDGGFNGGDIIKCGSYTGNNGQPHHVELGFEPQWLLVKNADLSTGGTWWSVVDVQRGMADNSIKVLKANESEAEINENGFTPTATGFTVSNNNDFQNNSTNTYIYIAIRRGTKVPESGTEVFEVTTQGAVDNNDPGFKTDWPVDFAIRTDTDGASNLTGSRLTGIGKMYTDDTGAENTTDPDMVWDFNNGWWGNSTTDSTKIAWLWKRAPKFFDAVAYTGDGVAGRTVSHNLGVAPEMMIVKSRTSAETWAVYHDAIGNTQRLVLNSTGTPLTGQWNSTSPDAVNFTLSSDGLVNGSGQNYIAYLFASLDGISKVGSFTHSNGSNTTVDCGFTSGARFVLVKQTDIADNWFVFDTERGITVSDSPALFLNNTNGESGASYIEPTNSGFIIKNGFWSAGDYIFYAIA